MKKKGIEDTMADGGKCGLTIGSGGGRGHYDRR
jgi:hypothetical protein